MKSKSINKGTRGRGRVAKACAQCRFAKTRCDFTYGATICTRCAERGIDCEPLEPNAKLRKGDLPKKPAVFLKHSTDCQDIRPMPPLGNPFKSEYPTQIHSSIPALETLTTKTANNNQYCYLPPEDDYQSALLAKQPSFERSWDQEIATRMQRDQLSDRKADTQQQIMVTDDSMMSSNFDILLSVVEHHTSTGSNSDIPPLLTPPEPQSFFPNPLQTQAPDFGEGYSYTKRGTTVCKGDIGARRMSSFDFTPNSTEASLYSSRNNSQDSPTLSIKSQGRKDSQGTNSSAISPCTQVYTNPSRACGGYDPQNSTNKASTEKHPCSTDKQISFDTTFSPYQSLYETCQSEQVPVSDSDSFRSYDKKPPIFTEKKGQYCQNTIFGAAGSPGYDDFSDSNVASQSKLRAKPEPEAQQHQKRHQSNVAIGTTNVSFTQYVLHTMYKHLMERIRLSSPYNTPIEYAFSGNLNLVTADVISREGAIELFGIFKKSYDDWLGLPEGEDGAVLDHILNQCPLLATACCSIALRFSSDQLWQSLYPKIVQFLGLELAGTLKNPPMNTECVQALTILAKYADSLCYNNHFFDMWRISASGIRLIEAISDRIGVLSYTYLRLWNQMVLAHICSANITGREVIISKAGVEICAKILETPYLLPTDNVIVAEVNIMWHTNRYMSHEIPFLDYEKEVQLWRNKWGEMKNLPVIQFIEPMLRFCLLLTQWVHAYRCSPSDHSSPNSKYSRGAISFTNYQPSIAPSTSSCMHSVILEDSMQCMVTHDLINELLSLNSVISSLIYRVEPRQFMYLSDNIRQVGFLCGIMALAACKILVTREPICYQAIRPLEICNDLIKKLALRFKMSSRSQDMASSQTMALLELLETVHWPSPQLTAYPSMAEV